MDERKRFEQPVPGSVDEGEVREATVTPETFADRIHDQMDAQGVEVSEPDKETFKKLGQEQDEIRGGVISRIAGTRVAKAIYAGMGVLSLAAAMEMGSAKEAEAGGHRHRGSGVTVGVGFGSVFTPGGPIDYNRTIEQDTRRMEIGTNAGTRQQQIGAQRDEAGWRASNELERIRSHERIETARQEARAKAEAARAEVLAKREESRDAAQIRREQLRANRDVIQALSKQLAKEKDPQVRLKLIEDLKTLRTGRTVEQPAEKPPVTINE